MHIKLLLKKVTVINPKLSSGGSINGDRQKHRQVKVKHNILVLGWEGLAVCYVQFCFVTVGSVI